MTRSGRLKIGRSADEWELQRDSGCRMGLELQRERESGCIMGLELQREREWVYNGTGVAERERVGV